MEILTTRKISAALPSRTIIYILHGGIVEITREAMKVKGEWGREQDVQPEECILTLRGYTEYFYLFDIRPYI